MPFISTPVVDKSNPCYCPDASAIQHSSRLPMSFASEDKIYDDDYKIWGQPLDFYAIPDSDALEPPNSRLSFAIQPPSFALSLSLSSASGTSSTLTSSSSSGSSSVAQRLSDPSRHARSSLIIANSSYELDGQASPIVTFFPRPSGHSPSSDAHVQSLDLKTLEGDTLLLVSPTDYPTTPLAF